MLCNLNRNARFFPIFGAVVAIALVGCGAYKPPVKSEKESAKFKANWYEVMSAKSLKDLPGSIQHLIEELEISPPVSEDDIKVLETSPVQALFSEKWETFRDSLHLNVPKKKRPESVVKQFNLLYSMKLQALSGKRYWGADRIAAGSIQTVENVFVHSRCETERAQGLAKGMISPEEYFSMKDRGLAPISVKQENFALEQWLDGQTRCVRYEGENRIQDSLVEPRDTVIWGFKIPLARSFALFGHPKMSAEKCEELRNHAFNIGAITHEELESLKTLNAYPMLTAQGKQDDLNIPVDQWMKTWDLCGEN